MGRGQKAWNYLKMTDHLLEKVKDILDASSEIVFFGGAGVSTASGIPDFRSATGLYHQPGGGRYSPETMLSHRFFIQHPGEFYNYYLQHLIIRGAKPNPAHFALARLEKAGKLKAIITQNIDGLHQAAGSKKVIELHGSVNLFYCMGCGARYELTYVEAAEVLPPLCPLCGKIVRPDVVLYGEPLDGDVIQAAMDAISFAEVLVVGGSSLVVSPAAGLINYYTGNKFILINRDPTHFDHRANYVLHGDIARLLPLLVGMASKRNLD